MPTVTLKLDNEECEILDKMNIWSKRTTLLYSLIHMLPGLAAYSRAEYNLPFTEIDLFAIDRLYKIGERFLKEEQQKAIEQNSSCNIVVFPMKT